jgi:hypothetical protein
LQKQKIESKALRDLLTTDEAVRRAVNQHGLIDTTAGMLSVRRSHGLGPKFLQRGRAIFYRRADLDAWCRERIAERAKEAARKNRSASRD